jgi:hypothetical protein
VASREPQRAAVDSECEQWWRYACETARLLARGVPGPATSVYGPVLEQGEHARLSARAWYGRLYAAGDGSWSTSGAVFAGGPAFMVGAVAGSMIARSRAKAQAAADAQIRWREHQHCLVVATDRRVLCDVAGLGWLSFWYSGAKEFYPDLQAWSVTIGYEETSPVRLHGPAVAGLIPWIARGILGPGWVNDPRLAPLLG